MRSALLALAFSIGALGIASAPSCKSASEPEAAPYFDRTIQPILTASCSRQTTGCHRADPKGNADLVSSGALPQGRADGCEDEYTKLSNAWNTLLGPYLK